jgi:hypothetical protein
MRTMTVVTGSPPLLRRRPFTTRLHATCYMLRRSYVLYLPTNPLPLLTRWTSTRTVCCSPSASRRSGHTQVVSSK